MKAIAYILFFAFYTVTICPTVQFVSAKIKSNCEAKCKMDKNESCPISDSDCCPIEMCKSCQCCFCAFVCPVDQKTFEIKLFQSTIKNKASSDAFMVSGFSSDCWQPPETV